MWGAYNQYAILIAEHADLQSLMRADGVEYMHYIIGPDGEEFHTWQEALEA